LRKLADRGSQADDTSCLRRLDGRVGEVEFRLVALRFGSFEVRDGAVALRLQSIDLALREFQVCLSGRDGGLLLVQLGGVLLSVLNRA
jgi:hypothetical protein